MKKIYLALLALFMSSFAAASSSCPDGLEYPLLINNGVISFLSEKTAISAVQAFQKKYLVVCPVSSKYYSKKPANELMIQLLTANNIVGILEATHSVSALKTGQNINIKNYAQLDSLCFYDIETILFSISAEANKDEKFKNRSGANFLGFCHLSQHQD